MFVNHSWRHLSNHGPHHVQHNLTLWDSEWLEQHFAAVSDVETALN